jgi:hypothetical protein
VERKLKLSAGFGQAASGFPVHVDLPFQGCELMSTLLLADLILIAPMAP